MEMGLGKTAVVLAEWANLCSANRVDALLVICPNSLKGTWSAEMDKVGMFGVERSIWPSVGGVMQFMNYEATITNTGRAFIQKFLESKRTMLVLDESIQVKNPQARRTKVLIAAAKGATYVRILSGEPVVQGPHDLWAQLRCLGYFDDFNYYAYRNTFCKMGGYLGKQVVGAQNVERLNKILEVCSFRARKGDWTDLPNKIYMTRTIEMTKKQQEHYIQMKKFLITMINEQEVDAQMVITQMLKLQQIGSGFIIDGNGTPHHIEGGNPKIAVVREILEEVSGKVLIFTWFRESARLLGESLSQSHGAAMMVGGMTPIDLNAAKDRFNLDPACRVLIVQIQTGKYGHTLLGTEKDRCATTIFYENSFSLDSRLQAEDRNHRIGQDRPVVYIDFIGSDIDRTVITALQKKQNIATSIIDNIRGKQ